MISKTANPPLEEKEDAPPEMPRALERDLANLSKEGRDLYHLKLVQIVFEDGNFKEGRKYRDELLQKGMFEPYLNHYCYPHVQSMFRKDDTMEKSREFGRAFDNSWCWWVYSEMLQRMERDIKEHRFHRARKYLDMMIEDGLSMKMVLHLSGNIIYYFKNRNPDSMKRFEKAFKGYTWK